MYQQKMKTFYGAEKGPYGHPHVSFISTIWTSYFGGQFSKETYITVCKRVCYIEALRVLIKIVADDALSL